MVIKGVTRSLDYSSPAGSCIVSVFHVCEALNVSLLAVRMIASGSRRCPTWMLASRCVGITSS